MIEKIPFSISGHYCCLTFLLCTAPQFAHMHASTQIFIFLSAHLPSCAFYCVIHHGGRHCNALHVLTRLQFCLPEHSWGVWTVRLHCVGRFLVCLSYSLSRKYKQSLHFCAFCQLLHCRCLPYYCGTALSFLFKMCANN